MSNPSGRLVRGAPLRSPAFRVKSPDPTQERTRWFASEVQPHGPQLKSYLRGSFPGVRDVEDVVQESFLRVWRARAARPIGSAKSFLFSVARHLAIDVLRRERVSPLGPLPDGEAWSVMDDRPDAAESACTREEIGLLAQALAELPPRCREVMLLRQIQGVPQKEIARQLGLSELTVQTHVVNGLRRLESILHRRIADRVRR